jgi:ribonuclease P protein component
MTHTFLKIERLCSKIAIDNLFEKGKSKTIFPIKVLYKESAFESPFPARVIFVVPKKKHKRANKRNTIKRRMREAYRLNKHLLYNALGTKKIDLMFIYLSNEEQEFDAIQKNICQLIEKVK